jgi:colanic acid biosynthesis glycosyl transferase WcaI
MRICLVNQFYAPDESPTAQLAASLCEYFAARGDTVTVLTSAGAYAGSGRIADQQPVGVSVRHLWTPAFGKKRLIGRLLDYLSFYLSAAWQAVRLPQQDVFIAMTTPPFIALTGVLHQTRHPKAKLVWWVMDCYPEVAEMAGMLRPTSLPSRMMRAVNRWIVRRSSAVVSLDGAMQSLLASYTRNSAQAPTFRVIANWERQAAFPTGQSYPTWPRAAELGLDGRLKLVYLGNMGVGHEFDTLIAAAIEMERQQIPVSVVLIGGGGRKAELQAAQQQHQLRHLHVLDYVPKAETAAVMASFDLALITLHEAAAGLISPSKMHSNLAQALPIVYIGPPASNVDAAIHKHQIGFSLRNGDVAGLVDCLRQLAANPAALEPLQDRARAAFDAEFNDRAAHQAFDQLLRQLQ